MRHSESFDHGVVLPLVGRPSSCLGTSGHDALSKLPRDAGAGQGMCQEELHARTLCKPESLGDTLPKQKGHATHLGVESSRSVVTLATLRTRPNGRRSALHQLRPTQ